MKLIHLGKGYFAKVDDQDYNYLMQWKWYYRKYHHTKVMYAARSVQIAKGPTRGSGRKVISMHRVVLGLTDPKIHTDHIDHDGLNNQRNNLRACTLKQNMYNKGKIGNKHGTCSSKYKGVCFASKQPLRPWIANIKHKNKSIYLGSFTTEEMAAKAFDKAAQKYHGEFAFKNFP